ncbi:MAG: alkaline phosphatase family protein [Cellvibrionales bacterium]|nr:alkaline phosphatase family protein [Cellvibrionales bacterium]
MFGNHTLYVLVALTFLPWLAMAENSVIDPQQNSPNKALSSELSHELDNIDAEFLPVQSSTQSPSQSSIQPITPSSTQSSARPTAQSTTQPLPPEGIPPLQTEPVNQDAAEVIEPLVVTPVDLSESRIKKKAILIGIDGVQFEKIKEHETPNFDRLMIRKAYTGGINHFASEQSTNSGPGWATTLTGVWSNKHKIKSNNANRANDEFPSIFKRIHQLNDTLTMASIMHWNLPSEVFFKRDMIHVNRVESNLTDAIATKTAIEEIQKGTEFILVQLNNVDYAGQQYGYGENYKKQLRNADQQLGKILDAIEQSSQTSSSEWLAIITTDHGRDKSGASHSKQTAMEKTVFIGVNRPLNEEFTKPLLTANSDFDNMYSHPAQTAITPTLLAWLGLPIDPFWLFESPPLIGELTIRKLMPDTHMTLRWQSEYEGKAEIYKNKTLVATIKATEGQWQDPNPPENDPVDYIVVIGEQGLAYRTKDYRGIRKLLKWQALERLRKALNIPL